MSTFEVLKVFPNGTAVVGTRGLYRVVLHPSREVVMELCELHEAKSYAKGFNAIPGGKFHASIESYPQPYVYSYSEA